MSKNLLGILLVILIIAASAAALFSLPNTRTAESRINIILSENSSLQGWRSSANYSYIVINLDWQRMGWSTPNGTYHAGNDLYLEITAYDENASMCAGLNTDILVGHTSTGMDELKPEPWKNIGDEYMSFQFNDGVARNPENSPMRFFKAEKIQFIVINESNGDSFTSPGLRIYPSELVTLLSEPSELTITAGDSRKFDLTGYDRFGNPVELVHENWTVDKHINYNGSELLFDERTFKAVSYIPDFVRKGFVHVTAFGPKGRTVKLNIPVTVEGEYDVWLEKDEVWPDHVLANEPLALSANIHYRVPANRLVGDALEVRINFALVELDENVMETNVLIDLYQENVHLSNLYGKPDKIHTVYYTIPQEFFRDHLNYYRKGMNDADKKPNYIKVELVEAPGGSNISDFESKTENNRVIMELTCVVPPPHGGCISFSPTISSLFLSLIFLGTISTIFSGRRKRGI